MKTQTYMTLDDLKKEHELVSSEYKMEMMYNDPRRTQVVIAWLSRIHLLEYIAKTYYGVNISEAASIEATDK